MMITSMAAADLNPEIWMVFLVMGGISAIVIFIFFTHPKYFGYFYKKIKQTMEERKKDGSLSTVKDTTPPEVVSHREGEEADISGNPEDVPKSRENPEDGSVQPDSDKESGNGREQV